MTTAMLVKGHLISPTQVELEEPVNCAGAEVEVVVRARGEGAEGTWEAYLAGLPTGTRTAGSIRSQIEQERDAWGTR
jgi:hypothetical protein